MGVTRFSLLGMLVMIGHISQADVSNHSSVEQDVKYPVDSNTAVNNPVDNKDVVIVAVLIVLALIALSVIIGLCCYCKRCRNNIRKEQEYMDHEEFFGMD